MTLAPVSISKTWVQGATLRYDFQLLDGNSNPINIAGWTGRAQVRNLPADQAGSVVIVASTGSRISLITDGTDGKFRLEFTEAESIQVLSTTYTTVFCDPELIDPSGDVFKYLKITFSVFAEYTR